MSVILVTYDLSTPGQDYKNFYEIIKSYPWAKLSESSYAISTSKTVKTVFEDIKQHIDQNDQLYVIKLDKYWNGYGPKDVNAWLNNHL